MISPVSGVHWPLIDFHALRDYSPLRICHVQESSEQRASLGLVAEETEVVAQHQDRVKVAQGWANIVDRHESDILESPRFTDLNGQGRDVYSSYVHAFSLQE